jgi:hypothetical protein
MDFRAGAESRYKLVGLFLECAVCEVGAEEVVDVGAV